MVFHLGGLLTAFVLYQMGGDSTKAEYPYPVQQAFEKLSKQIGLSSPKEKEVRQAPSKAIIVLEAVTTDFDTRTRHIATARTLDHFFEGTLAGQGEVFIEAGRKTGRSPFFLAAIAMHESGNGKSRFSKEFNNPMGILVGGKTPRVFGSTEEAVNFMADRLCSGLYKDRYTVEEIQKRYCPVGAVNDPTGLNKHWLAGVTKWMNRFCQKEIEMINKTGVEIASR
ncbi:MAG: glucosaminidase domain-containing protein [Candidatus Paceibacterota bacterium]